jgi:hypothetical protein
MATDVVLSPRQAGGGDGNAWDNLFPTLKYGYFALKPNYLSMNGTRPTFKIGRAFNSGDKEKSFG